MNTQFVIGCSLDSWMDLHDQGRPAKSGLSRAGRRRGLISWRRGELIMPELFVRIVLGSGLNRGVGGCRNYVRFFFFAEDCEFLGELSDQVDVEI